MARRQREWARKAYARLIEQLGGKCKHCGAIDKLEIDHIYGASFDHPTLEWSWRVSIYRREAAAGLVQLLCGPCNLKKGRPVEVKTIVGTRRVLVHRPFWITMSENSKIEWTDQQGMLL